VLHHQLLESEYALSTKVKLRFEFIEQNFLLIVSTLLNPRFKNILFKDPVSLSKHLVFIQSSINSMENSTADMDYSKDSSNSVLVVSDPSKVDLWGYHKQLTQKSQKKYIEQSNQRNQQHLGS